MLGSKAMPRGCGSPSTAPLGRTRAVARRARVVAAASDNEADALTRRFGFPSVEEGMFGFKPFPELFVGRVAMAGFAYQLADEFAGKGGFLRQVGFVVPDDGLFYGLCAFFGVAVAVGIAKPFADASSGEMTARDAIRYRNFLRLNGEAGDVASAASDLKAAGDFTTPANSARESADIAAAKAEGTAADAFLTPDARPAAAVAEEEAKAPRGDARYASVSLAAKEDVLEQLNAQSGSFEEQFLKTVELSNARWAMLGYLAAVLVEAKTGQGPLGQIAQYLVWANVLGPDSGFSTGNFLF